MVQLWTSWTVSLGPPVEYQALGTDCGGDVTRQCQVAHDRAVDAMQSQEGHEPVPGTPEVHWTVPPQ